ncbi:MAG: N-acetylmuramoyl-L-alanine amidase [Candidatus Sumerlaeia bacterium]|nr:N-acetylmuramoyl-L-alanine amidase [Candidatus Sumerlaeia bacterium]
MTPFSFKSLRSLLILPLLMAVQLAFSQAEIKEIRVHHHGDYTRAVIELDRAVNYRVRNYSQQHEMIQVEISGVSSGVSTVQLNSSRSFVSAHAVRYEEVTKSFRMNLRTINPVTTKDQTLENPFRIVVDIYRDEEAVSASDSASESSSNQPRATPIVSNPGRPGGWSRRIIVDPGHGGHHGGGVGRLNGRTVYEKEVALPVAERLERLLKADPRFEVFLTRRQDVYVGLAERTQIASRLNGDLFVSIHANAVDGRAAQQRARGFEIWTWNPTANTSAARRAMERMENEDPLARINQGNNQILTSMMRDALNTQAVESRRVARYVHQVAIRDPYLRNNDRGIDKARFRVLEIYDMPSILVELGFMTHPEEVRMLFSASFQQKWAQIMYDGIVEYYAATDPEFPRSKNTPSLASSRN